MTDFPPGTRVVRIDPKWEPGQWVILRPNPTYPAGTRGTVMGRALEEKEKLQYGEIDWDLIVQLDDGTIAYWNVNLMEKLTEEADDGNSTGS